MEMKIQGKKNPLEFHFIASDEFSPNFLGENGFNGPFFSFFGHGPLRMICRGNENTRKENRDADSMEMPPTNKQEGEIEREIRNRRTGDGETEKRDSYHFDFAD